ncbi:hypothetical protein PIB30_027846 [Stylosanthes scabra]|uniref:Uncharacterized protein n=1 Tax=Stylosanthes scabra TaxID=79078 RepID=A0ABU6UB25_9FABA|nr:hypothetical protein [Stylosanthes scabra]
MSASWRVVELDTSNDTNEPKTDDRQEKSKLKDGRSTSAINREKRAAELLKLNDEVIAKLENAAIERSRSVESAVLGKYSIWRKEVEYENAESTVRLMRDQNVKARVYLSIAKMKNKLELFQELQTRLKESKGALGDATSDADLNRRLLAMHNFIKSTYIAVFLCHWLNLLI